MTDDLITAVERSKKGAVVTLNGEEKIFVSRALLIEREFAEGLVASAGRTGPVAPAPAVSRSAESGGQPAGPAGAQLR